MNRVIRCKVDNEYIRGAGVVIGAAGSHDDVELELTFSPMWFGTSRKIVWFDALGERTAVTELTTNLLVPGETEVYRVPVPWEAKAVEGEMKLTIRGVNTSGNTETRAVVAATASFQVLRALWDDEAVASSEPSAAVSDQLQEEIEAIKEELLQVPAAVEDAQDSAQAAADSAQSAKDYSGKPPVIQNGTWWTWDGSAQAYTDTGDPARGPQGPKGEDATVSWDELTPEQKESLKGDPGAGVPTGGTLWQALVKTGAADYATGWKTLAAGDVGARPSTWMPTAADVGAKASAWSPFHAGTSAPGDRTQLWIDTTANTGGLKYWNGSAWVVVPVGYT